MSQRVRWFVLIIIFLSTMTSLGGCRAGLGGTVHKIEMAEVRAMPSHVQHAPQLVLDAYRFSATHSDELHQIPCYCGCGAMGHGSNYACFWQEDGQVDDHALGCGICVDIAHDVRRALARGQPLAEIRAQIDADYSRFGPPTDTAPVAAVK